MPKIIVDPGSCHIGKIEYAKELIDLAARYHLSIKFQLFKDAPPNIPLPREWWGELVEYTKERINIFASCDDDDALELLKKHGTRYVKFGYNERKQFKRIEYAKTFAKVIVSCPLLEIDNYPDCIKLFCIPEYPVLYEIDFRKVFKYFDGFSDHTLGYYQTMRATEYGAQIIEKHITLDHDDIKCPDHMFALKPAELGRWRRYADP